MLALAAEAARGADPDPAALAAEARRRAEAFETAALRAGAPRDAVGEARDALIAVLEARALGNPALPAGRWAQARRRALPGVPEPDAALLGRRRAAAEAAGPARRDLARFLRHCEEAVQAAPPPRAAAGRALGARSRRSSSSPPSPPGPGWAEWRYSARLLAGMPAGRGGGRAGGGLAGSGGAASSTRMAAAAADGGGAAPAVAARPRGAPRPLRPGRGGASGATPRRSTRCCRRRRRRRSPTTLATEGGSLALYDTLRTLAILEGEAPWQPGFVAGWLAERAATDPALSGARPARRRRFPARRRACRRRTPSSWPRRGRSRPRAIRPPSPSSSSPATRAMQALPGWSPAGVPDLATVLVRRSGRPIDQAIPGLFTAAGWAAASDGGARDAIARAAAEARG